MHYGYFQSLSSHALSVYLFTAYCLPTSANGGQARVTLPHLQGYLLVLLGGPPSLLGLAYLALLIAIFVAPPPRGAYLELDDMGRPVAASRSAVSAIFHGRQLHLSKACGPYHTIQLR